MEDRENLRAWLVQYNLTQSWLIDTLRRRGLEVDKTTLSSALKGTITGPRVTRIMEVSHEIQDRYEKFVQSISV